MKTMDYRESGASGSKKDKLAKNLDELAVVRKNVKRYEYAKGVGHDTFCQKYRRCEDFYIGEGRQWSYEDRCYVENELGRPVYEVNEIQKAVSSAAGYQIQNRMDVSFRPANGKSDSKLAEIMSKVFKQIATRNNLYSSETIVFTDALIGGRGFYDVRVDYSRNFKGEIVIETLDPMDVIPDPDAKSYDPDQWSDVMVLRYMTIDEAVSLYGEDRRMELIEAHGSRNDDDFGADDMTPHRNKFGDIYDTGEVNCSGYETEEGETRIRVFDRQYFTREMCKVAIFNERDIRSIEGVPPEAVAAMIDEGAVIAKRMMKTIRWCVTTSKVILHNEISPYSHFTIVPCFANFRRGLTLGIVANAIDMQEILNKTISQYMHIVNTTSNSGWLVKEGSLVNMDIEELEKRGAETGVVIEYKGSEGKPEKITPNQVPSGISEIMNIASNKIKEITVPDVAQGQSSGPEVSGIAIQTKQYAAQKQLAIQLDNLSLSRNILARNVLDLVQKFYDYSMTLRVTEQDPVTGQDMDVHIELNQEDPTQDEIYINDLTAGDYDIVITEQPITPTFGNSQFEQAMEMKKAGINIPDAVVLRYSNLSDKYDIIAQMTASKPGADPTIEAKVALMAAQTELTKGKVAETAARTTEIGMDTMFSSLNTAAIITGDPATSPVADKMLKSAGFVDQNAGPIIPPITSAAAQVGPGAATPPVDQQNQSPLAQLGMRQNTSPNFPPNPDVGLMKGLEAGQ